MKKLVMPTVLLLCAFEIPAQCQIASRWYVFAAPGVGNAAAYGYNGRGIFHFGGGGERFIYRGLAAGAEIGPVVTWSVPGGGLNVLRDRVRGLGSANLSYHFIPKSTDRKLEPFVTTGYSLFFANGGNTSSGWNVGSGANVWLTQHAAMRVNVTYHHSFVQKVMDVGIGMSFR